ncbi:MAG: antibiotic biosynthesis monooxygenase family protein [Bacteroidota bacterium]
MLIRIVRLSFNSEHVEEFLNNFEINKSKIRNFKGCEKLELLRDKNHENVFFTYSYWNSDVDLENYRNSELFASVWAKTKILFNDKPQAWSVERLVEM